MPAAVSAAGPTKRARTPATALPPAAARGSASEPAAIDDEDVAIDVIRCGRREEHGRTREIGRRAPPAGGNAFADLPRARVVGPQLRRVVRDHVAGRDRVDVDAAARPLVGERLGELRDAALRGRITGDGDAA